MQDLIEKFLVTNRYTHFNKKDIALQLQTHPENPSFRAITDTLDYFGIENLAATVPEEALPMLPKTFLTIVDDNGQQELVLVTKKKEQWQLTTENGKRKLYDLDRFKQIWSNHIIAIEKTEQSTRWLSTKKISVLVAMVLLVTYLIINPISLLQSINLIFAAVGLYLSYLLVKEKIGYHSNSVLNICTATPNSNCNEVINSKGGVVSKDISLADASFMYFVFLVFQTLFLGIEGVFFLTILLSLPVIFYSVYYQAVVIKKWCPLCLGVAAVLVALNVLLLMDPVLIFTPQSIIRSLLLVACILPVYMFIKKLIVTQQKHEQELLAATRFKRNPEIIKNLLKSAKHVEDIQLLPNEVVIGNLAGTYQITTYTNPLCGHCKAAFKSYVKMAHIHSNLKIIIRFSVGGENVETPAVKIAANLIEIYKAEGQEAFIQAYKEWFENREVDAWLKEYETNGISEATLHVLQQQRAWSTNNDISYTPATILNTAVFPSTYGYTDLVYVIDDIIEFQNNETKKQPTLV